MKNHFLTLTFVLAVLLLASCTTKDEGTTYKGDWVNRTPYQFPGTPRGGAFCFVIDNKAYMGLGYTGKAYPQDFFVLDLAGETWSPRQNFPAYPVPEGTTPPANPDAEKGRERTVAFAIGGKGYVGLGYNRDDAKGLKNGGKDFYSYDPGTNEWTRVADFIGSARYDAIGFSLNGKGYVGTGLDAKGNYCSDMFQYDPAADPKINASLPADSNPWKQIGTFPGGKRNRAYALSLNGMAYAGGGLSSGSYNNNDFWRFDGSTWTSLRPKSDVAYWASYIAAVNRADANIFSVNGKIYLANGIGSSGSIVTSCYEWDPSDVSNAWVQKNGFEFVARHLAVSFTIGNRGFVCAGQNSSGFWDNTIELLPDATLDGTN